MLRAGSWNKAFSRFYSLLVVVAYCCIQLEAWKPTATIP
jgi:hypothetical protein